MRGSVALLVELRVGDEADHAHVAGTARTDDRRTLTEALIRDGGVINYATAENLTEAPLRFQAEHLPQFG